MIYLLLSKIPETNNKYINKSKWVINDLSEGLFQHFLINPVTTPLTNRVKLVYLCKCSIFHTILGCAVRVILGILVEICPPLPYPPHGPREVRTPHGIPPLPRATGVSKPSIKRASGVQVLSYKRAISVQYPGPFGVKSPLVGFKPS